MARNALESDAGNESDPPGRSSFRIGGVEDGSMVGVIPNSPTLLPLRSSLDP
jgi:hypothetical protein